MKILITGINSSLARKTAEFHLQQGHEVTGIYHKQKDSVSPQIKLVGHDQLNKLTNDFSLVYVIGAYVPRQAYDIPHKSFYDTNIEQVNRLCRTMPDARMVFCSSVAVYGENTEIIHENSCYKQPSLYALSKLAGEMVVKQHKSYAILRFSSIYGKGVAANNFINRCHQQAMEKKEIMIYGNGERRQNYIFLDDAAKLLIISGKSDLNDTLLCTGPQSYSNKQVAEIFHKLKPGIQVKYTGTDESFSYYYNNSVSMGKLGNPEFTDIENGIAHICANEI